jgi:hypothetical protein
LKPKLLVILNVIAEGEEEDLYRFYWDLYFSTDASKHSSNVSDVFTYQNSQFSNV